MNFKLRFEFADQENLQPAAVKDKDGNVKIGFDMSSLVNVTNVNGEITVRVTLAKGASLIDKEKATRAIGWTNRIPEQANCQDYDALHLPLIIRQDTISDTHPFKYDGVSKIVRVLKAFMTKNCFKDQNLLDSLKAAGLQPFPWFVYFVPSNSHKDFKFQKPKMPAEHESDEGKIRRIVQIAVGFPTTLAVKNKNQ